MGVRLKKGKGYIGFVFIAIIISLGFLGTGYGYWSESSSAVIGVNMASFIHDDPSNPIIKCQPSSRIDYRDVGNQMKIIIYDDKAEVGDGKGRNKLKFQIRNNGGIPVMYKVDELRCDTGLRVEFNLSDEGEFVERSGWSKQNEIIYYPASSGTTYNFSAVLKIRQWNEGGWSLDIPITGTITTKENSQP